jgi:hypothetical protein
MNDVASTFVNAVEVVSKQLSVNRQCTNTEGGNSCGDDNTDDEAVEDSASVDPIAEEQNDDSGNGSSHHSDNAQSPETPVESTLVDAHGDDTSTEEEVAHIDHVEDSSPENVDHVDEPVKEDDAAGGDPGTEIVEGSMHNDELYGHEKKF